MATTTISIDLACEPGVAFSALTTVVDHPRWDQTVLEATEPEVTADGVIHFSQKRVIANREVGFTCAVTEIKPDRQFEYRCQGQHMERLTERYELVRTERGGVRVTRQVTFDIPENNLARFADSVFTAASLDRWIEQAMAKLALHLTDSTGVARGGRGDIPEDADDSGGRLTGLNPTDPRSQNEVGNE